MTHEPFPPGQPDWPSIRKEFSMFDEAIYLTTNSGGLISQTLLNKIQVLYGELARQGSQVWVEWPPRLEEARTRVAHMIEASIEGIAFIQNVSQGIHLLEGMLPSDSAIMYFEDEFPAGVLPWKHRGYTMISIPGEADGSIRLDRLASYISPKTRMLLASHVMYQTGYRMDLKSLGEFCREHGLLFLVDATQSAGMFEIQCQSWNIDIALFSAYKWLNAGYGIGAMYIRPEVLQAYPFRALGWKSVSYEKLYELNGVQMLPGARRFELGHPDFIRIQALGEAIYQLEQIGFPQIQNRILDLVDYTYQLCQKNDIPILSYFPVEHRSGILRLPSFAITAEQFAEAGFRVRVREDVLTLGISFYNLASDLEKIIQFIVQRA